MLTCILSDINPNLHFVLQVRKFHEQFYCPKNTALVIVGVIEEKKLFDVIRKFEEKILSKVSFQLIEFNF